MGTSKKKSADSAPTKGGMFRTALRSLLCQFYRPSTLILAAAAVVIGLFLPQLTEFLPDLSQRPEYQLPADQIEVTQPPHWVPRKLVEQVIEDGGLSETLNLLDEGLVQEVAEAFQLNPWVEEVIEVRKSYPAKLVVQLNYRRPVAMVEIRKGRLPIDSHGVLLPANDFVAAEADAYPLIKGIATTPQGPAGTKWGDPVVEDAAAIAGILSSVWNSLGLQAINCPASSSREAKTDEGVFELEARGGTRILWGHAPGSKNPGELSIEQKVGRLQDYVKRFGGFDQPHGPYKIDIRHRNDISRVPLSAHNAPIDRIRL